ncbi:hypothetical protein [Nonomuraea dietziae]
MRATWGEQWEVCPRCARVLFLDARDALEAGTALRLHVRYGCGA